MMLATYAHVTREHKGLPGLSAEAQIQVARRPRRPQVDHGVQLELLADEPREHDSPASDRDSSAWIRTRDLTIMSRARAANGGEARRLEHTKGLEVADIANTTLARDLPGLCHSVDAWWTPRD